MVRPGEFRLGLYEATTRRVATHLTHIEDLVYLRGVSGAEQAYHFLDNIANLLSGDADAPVDLSVKLDGSPAIIFGIDPADGKFFIGTKSVFNVKTPKLIKSLNDVSRFYGDHALAPTLAVVFEALRHVQMTGVVQGDLLCTPDNRHVQDVRGVRSLVFTPNTITYTVPLTSELGMRLARSQVALAVHTEWTGVALDRMTASPLRDLSGLKAPGTVVLLSASYRNLAGTMGLTRDQYQLVKDSLASLKKATAALRTNPVVKTIEQDTTLARLLLQFQNVLVRDKFTELPPTGIYLGTLAHFFRAEVTRQAKRQPVDTTRYDQLLAKLAGYTEDDDPNEWNAVISEFIKARNTVELERMAQRRQQRAAQGSGLDTMFLQHVKPLDQLLDWQRQVVRLKLVFLEKLKSVKHIETYVAEGDGLVAGSHEGFVASDASGTTVKLVDRTAFSYHNFLKHQVSPLVTEDFKNILTAEYGFAK